MMAKRPGKRTLTLEIYMREIHAPPKGKHPKLFCPTKECKKSLLLMLRRHGLTEAQVKKFEKEHIVETM